MKRPMPMWAVALLFAVITAVVAVPLICLKRPAPGTPSYLIAKAKERGWQVRPVPGEDVLVILDRSRAPGVVYLSHARSALADNPLPIAWGECFLSGDQTMIEVLTNQ